VEHGVFGYGASSSELVEVLCQRMQRLYRWQVTPEQIVLIPGVVSGLNVACRAFGKPGDAALMLTPIYPPFLTAPANHGMEAITVPLTLRRAQAAQTFDYTIDFDKFERAITP